MPVTQKDIEETMSTTPMYVCAPDACKQKQAGEVGCLLPTAGVLLCHKRLGTYLLEACLLCLQACKAACLRCLFAHPSKPVCTIYLLAYL
jgi:hypothetical protein